MLVSLPPTPQSTHLHVFLQDIVDCAFKLAATSIPTRTDVGACSPPRPLSHLHRKPMLDLYCKSSVRIPASSLQSIQKQRGASSEVACNFDEKD